MNKNNIKKSGFTLIELLVVIAIIGLLSTLSVVALSSAREKARNAKRVADIKQIQTALELYYNDNNAYPTSVDFSGTGTITNAGIIYMGSVPVNPAPWEDGSCTNSNYIYESALANTYSIYYCLSADTGGITGGINHATPAGIAY
jgi:general secretion pathway protein G